MKKTVLVAVAALLSTGCSAVTASARISSDLSIKTAEERSEQFAPGVARPLLNAGNTVAFLPPTDCLDVTAAPATAVAETTLLRNRCGVIMSELERAAAANGLQVFSWQGLSRGTHLEQARAMKVDAVIEVDELTLNRASPARESELKVEFFEADPFSARTVPLKVPNARDTADLCRKNFGAETSWNEADRPITSATASIKLVGPGEGKDRWFFRRTLPSDTRFELTSNHQFRSGASGVGAGVMLAFGIVGVVAGGAMAGVAVSGSNTGLLIGSAPLFAGGLGLLVPAIIRLVSRPGPADIVCQAEYLDVQDTTVSTQVDLAGTRYTFKRSSAAALDAQRIAERKLVAALANDVIKALVQPPK